MSQFKPYTDKGSNKKILLRSTKGSNKKILLRNTKEFFENTEKDCSIMTQVMCGIVDGTFDFPAKTSVTNVERWVQILIWT